jgi:uncharacterized metal-binding protein
VTELGKPVLVIPCSGIGKAFGSIGRDATFRVVDELRKGKADTLCLSLLVMGDEEARDKAAAAKCIAVDGCPLECAGKNIVRSGGGIATHFWVMELLKENRGLKTGEVTFLDENGVKLSKLLAERIARKVDELAEEDR